MPERKYMGLIDDFKNKRDEKFSEKEFNEYLSEKTNYDKKDISKFIKEIKKGCNELNLSVEATLLRSNYLFLEKSFNDFTRNGQLDYETFSEKNDKLAYFFAKEKLGLEGTEAKLLRATLDKNPLIFDNPVFGTYEKTHLLNLTEESIQQEEPVPSYLKNISKTDCSYSNALLSRGVDFNTLEEVNIMANKEENSQLNGHHMEHICGNLLKDNKDLILEEDKVPDSWKYLRDVVTLDNFDDGFYMNAEPMSVKGGLSNPAFDMATKKHSHFHEYFNPENQKIEFVPIESGSVKSPKYDTEILKKPQVEKLVKEITEKTFSNDLKYIHYKMNDRTNEKGLNAVTPLINNVMDLKKALQEVMRESNNNFAVTSMAYSTDLAILPALSLQVHLLEDRLSSIINKTPDNIKNNSLRADDFKLEDCMAFTQCKSSLSTKEAEIFQKMQQESFNKINALLENCIDKSIPKDIKEEINDAKNKIKMNECENPLIKNAPEREGR